MGLRFVKRGLSPAGPRWLSVRGTTDDDSASRIRQLVSDTDARELLDIPGVSYREQGIHGTAFVEVLFDLPINVLFADLPGVRDIHAFLADARTHTLDAHLRDVDWLPACTRALGRLPLLEHMRPYQRSALHWLLQRPSALLGDDMGLGKTMTTIRAAETAMAAVSGPAVRDRAWHRPNPFTLVLGPKTLRGEWKNQLRQWSTDEATRRGETFYACTGLVPRPEEIQPHHRWVYCHYDILHAWVHRLYPLAPAVVIADEAHALKGLRTKRREAGARAFGMGLFGWQLTGTPILNRLREMHALYDVMDSWSFGSEGTFRRRYMGALDGAYGLEDGDLQHEDELRARIATCYLARKKCDVGLQLPALTRSLRAVELEAQEYEDIENVLGGLPPQALFDALLRGAGGPQTAHLITRARQLVARAKVASTVNAAQDALEGGESVVVFSGFRDTANRIAKALEKDHEVSFITGALTQAQREQQIDRFRAEGDVPRAIVATYATLAVGVNLQRASVGVFNDLTWTPAELLQAEARFYRGGQTRPCTSVWQVARGTIDDLLLACLSTKANLVRDALGDSDAANLLDLLGPDKHEAVRQAFDAWVAQRQAMSQVRGTGAFHG